MTARGLILAIFGMIFMGDIVAFAVLMEPFGLTARSLSRELPCDLMLASLVAAILTVPYLSRRRQNRRPLVVELVFVVASFATIASVLANVVRTNKGS